MSESETRRSNVQDVKKIARGAAIEGTAAYFQLISPKSEGKESDEVKWDYWLKSQTIYSDSDYVAKLYTKSRTKRIILIYRWSDVDFSDVPEYSGKMLAKQSDDEYQLNKRVRHAIMQARSSTQEDIDYSDLSHVFRDMKDTTGSHEVGKTLTRKAYANAPVVSKEMCPSCLKKYEDGIYKSEKKIRMIPHTWDQCDECAKDIARKKLEINPFGGGSFLGDPSIHQSLGDVKLGFTCRNCGYKGYVKSSVWHDTEGRKKTETECPKCHVVSRDLDRGTQQGPFSSGEVAKGFPAAHNDMYRQYLMTQKDEEGKTVYPPSELNTVEKDDDIDASVYRSLQSSRHSREDLPEYYSEEYARMLADRDIDDRPYVQKETTEEEEAEEFRRHAQETYREELDELRELEEGDKD